MDGFEKYLRNIIYQLLVICSMWDDEKKKKGSGLGCKFLVLTAVGLWGNYLLSI